MREPQRNPGLLAQIRGAVCPNTGGPASECEKYGGGQEDAQVRPGMSIPGPGSVWHSSLTQLAAGQESYRQARCPPQGEPGPGRAGAQGEAGGGLARHCPPSVGLPASRQQFAVGAARLAKRGRSIPQSSDALVPVLCRERGPGRLAASFPDVYVCAATDVDPRCPLTASYWTPTSSVTRSGGSSPVIETMVGSGRQPATCTPPACWAI